MREIKRLSDKVRVEEPEEWYEKLQEEIKLYSRENRR